MLLGIVLKDINFAKALKDVLLEEIMKQLKQQSDEITWLKAEIEKLKLSGLALENEEN